MTVTAPIVAALGGSAKAAMDFESAFAGVRKTVTASEPEFARLSAGFRAMALDIPLAVEELASIGEAAGQLGIKTPQLLSFTDTMAKLGVATNLTSTEAATSLARFANIMGTVAKEGDDAFSRMGATIVDLGNNFATTEAEIVAMATNLAGAAAAINMSEQATFGLATAMSSVGVQAELGGTAMQKMAIQMASAVSKGGAELTKFAKIAEMPADAFRKLFSTDSGAAMTKFIEGLGRVKQSGGDLIATLQQLGIDEARMQRVFLSLAGGSDLVSEATKRANVAWRENVALNREAAQRFQTTESQLRLAWNAIKDVGIELGAELLPALKDVLVALKPFISTLADVVKWWAALPSPVKTASLALAGIAAAVGPTLVVLGTLVQSVGAVAGGLSMLAPASATVAAGASKAGIAVAGLKVALAALGTVAAVVASFFAGWKFGSWIGEISGATDAVGKFATRLLYGKEAAAQYDAMRRAQRDAEARAGLPTVKRTGDVSLPFEVKPPTAPAPPGGGDKPFNPLAGLPTSDASEQVDDLKKKIADLDFALRAAQKSGASSAVVVREYGSAIEDVTNKASVFGVKLPQSFEFGARAVRETKLSEILRNEAEDAHRRFEKFIADSSARVVKEADRASDAYLKNLGIQSRAATELVVADEKRTLSKIDFEIRQLERARDAEIASLDKSASNHAETAAAIKASFEQRMREARETHDKELKAMSAQADTWGKRFKTVIESIPQLLKSAFTGGGGISGFAKALTTQLGESIAGKGITDLLTSGVNKMATKLSNVFGTGFVSTLGNLIPGIGSALGALVGPLVGKIAGLFKKESMKVNDMRDEFLAQFGGSGTGLGSGFRTLADQLHTLGAAGDAMFQRLINAKKVDEFKRVVDDINAAMGKQANEVERADAALAKYGITWEDLPNKQQHVTNAANELLEELRLITEVAGVDSTLALSKMSGAFSQLAQDAVRTGTEIPAALRSTIERLIEMGELVDADGNKITSLEGSGIKFAETMTQGFDRVVGALNLVAEGLGIKVPASMKAGSAVVLAEADIVNAKLANLAQERRVQLDVDVTYNDPGFTPRASETTVNVEGAASGVFATRPTLRVFGEGGEPELGGPVDFMSKALAGALVKLGGESGGAPSSGGNVTLVVQGNDTGELRAYLERTFLPMFIDALRQNRGGNTSDLIDVLRQLGLGG